MLELRPGCENCDTPLPPHSGQAMICSFECTFCRDCVERVLANVCPNCGGGFQQRPVRPAQDRKNGNYLGRYPASTKMLHKPVDVESHQELAGALMLIDPDER